MKNTDEAKKELARKERERREEKAREEKALQERQEREMAARQEKGREQRARRKTAERSGHKVVLASGTFTVAPLSFEGAPEAHASKSERARQGLLPSGKLSGLPRGFALKLARRLQAARTRNRRRA